MSDVLILNADGRPLSENPLSVIPWTKAVQQVFLDKVKVIKEYDDWVIHSQHMEMKVPSIVIRTNQVKWSKQLKYSRGNVYLRDDHTCQLQITGKCRDAKGRGHKVQDLTIDHVLPSSKGGKTDWKNVCTACKACNSEKGNDESIVPRKKPHVPTYYEILAKRRNMPMHIRDVEWKHYIDWPEDLFRLVPHQNGQIHYIEDDRFDDAELD